QTLMLALSAHGLASCPQTALSFLCDAVREECGVDPSHRLLFGISFGYEDAANPANDCRLGRAALADNVRFLG
ncbi:MAG: nitroreductase family protein, partial [Pseudomonadales bacterium]|nr:nitroreductase family protein [Pseudomonadales bacterium]